MASAEEANLNTPHPPHENAIAAFKHVLHDIHAAVIKSRHEWDQHEPKMWARASALSDHQLAGFTEHDVVEIRSGKVSYGTIIFGKIRIPAVKDEDGEGFIFVRIFDPPDRGTDDIKFHSIFHYESKDHPAVWRAIHTKDTPLEFFNE